MTDFSRVYEGFRLVETRRGDTLRAVASRELGDPTRWWELAFINALVPPYLTDDPAEASDGVRLTGDRLSVPSSADYVPAQIDPEAVFGIDVALSSIGEMNAADGDLVTVAGGPNLTQAMRHVLATTPGGLEMHPTYGCSAWFLIGQKATPAAMRMIDGLIRRAVQADARVDSVTRAESRIDGDALHVEMTAQATNGVSIRATL